MVAEILLMIKSDLLKLNFPWRKIFDEYHSSLKDHEHKRWAFCIIPGIEVVTHSTRSEIFSVKRKIDEQHSYITKKTS